MARIKLINVYVGYFSWYFPFFIKSCTVNSFIEFTIFYDSSYTRELPDNFPVIPFLLDNFNRLACEKLKINISVTYPYKFM